MNTYQQLPPPQQQQKQQDPPQYFNEPIFKQEYLASSAPISPMNDIPINTSKNNSISQEQAWMTDFFVNSAPISQTNSPVEISTYLPSNPINFAPYFEENNRTLQQSSNNSSSTHLFSGSDLASSSNETSLANSPETQLCSSEFKSNLNNGMVFPSVSNKLNKEHQLNVNSLEDVFKTQGILKPEPSIKVKQEPFESSMPKEQSQEQSKPKKRAPRKKLTETQKKAHNKIEKKYRININAKIAGIQKIIPWVAFEKTAFETGESQSQQDLDKCNKLNKSMILEKATEYILHLQKKEQEMSVENEELKQKVLQLGGSL